jgi:glycosyltransferase 2 family protein
MSSDRKRYLDFLWALVGLAAVGFAFWLLYRELRGLSAVDVWQGLRAISPIRYFFAVIATIAAYAALAWYDRIALLHLGRRLSWLCILATSFTSYALSHNIGMTVMSGAVVRYRAYSSKGLIIAEVAVVVAFCSFTFALGTTLLGGFVLVADPQFVRRFDLPQWLRQATGLGMLALVALYVAGSLLQLPPLILGSLRIVYPRPSITLRQIVAGPLELVGAAGIIYFALPEAVNPGFLVVLGVFLASFSVALLSHAPGGLGVLELVFLNALPGASHAEVIAALVVFRMLYLVLPLAVGVGLAVAFERNRLAAVLRRA